MRLIILSSLFFTYLSSADPVSLRNSYQEGLDYQILSITTATITGYTKILNLTKAQHAPATYTTSSGMTPNGVLDCGTNNCLVTKVSFPELKNSLGMDYKEQVFTFLNKYVIFHSNLVIPTSPIADIVIDNENSTVNFYAISSISYYPENGDIAQFLPALTYTKGSRSLKDLYKEGLQYQILAVLTAGITGDVEVLDLTRPQRALATYAKSSVMTPNGVFDCGNNNCLVTKVPFSKLKKYFGIDYKEQVFTFLGKYSIRYNSVRQPTSPPIVDIVLDKKNSTVNFYSPSPTGIFPKQAATANFIFPSTEYSRKAP